MFETGLVASIGIFVLLGVLIAAGWAVGIYNSLVQLRENCDKAFKNIDVLLKQRHDELPKLLAVCKGFMAHEQALLESVAAQRARCEAAGSVEAKVASENLLNAVLAAFFARVEAYPELKSAANVLEMQGRIGELESSISQRREFFNDSVGLHNIYIRKFPQVLLAGRPGFFQRSYLKVTEAEKIDPA